VNSKKVVYKGVKWLPGTRLPVLKWVTGFKNEQLVIKKFQTPQYALFIDNFDILIYELYTR